MHISIATLPMGGTLREQPAALGRLIAAILKETGHV